MADFINDTIEDLPELKNERPVMAGRSTTDYVLGPDLNKVRGHLSSIRTSIRGREYNVRHYGAKGDGATDDTAAIQAAIAAAAAAGGGIVHMPTGVYLLSGTLQMKSRVRMRAECHWTLEKVLTQPASAQNAAVLKLANGANCNMVEFAQGVVAAGLFGVVLDGNKANNTAGDGVVFTDTGTGFRGRNTLDEVHIRDVAGRGVWVSQYHHEAMLSRVYVHGAASHGIHQQGEDARWRDVWAGYCGGDGFTVDTRGALRTHNCDSFLNTGRGLHLNNVATTRHYGLQTNGNGQEGVLITAGSRHQFLGGEWFGDGREYDGTTHLTRYSEVRLTHTGGGFGPFGIRFVGVGIGSHFQAATTPQVMKYGLEDDCTTVRPNIVIGCQFASGEFASGITNVLDKYAFGNCVDYDGTNHTLVANAVRLGGTSTLVAPNTQDGNDNSKAQVTGGGAAGATRGGYLEVAGNEASSSPGNAFLVAGDAGNARLQNGANYVQVEDNGTRVVGGVGFYNTAPVVTKLAVSGSRGGNAALASLLTQLAALGLITDSTTA